MAEYRGRVLRHDTGPATYPVVIDDSTNKFGQKTDGTNGTINCATNGVANLTVEYGIITGYTCR